MLLYASFGVASPFWPLFLESRGVTAGQLGLLFGLGILIRLISGPVCGRVADLLGALRARPHSFWARWWSANFQAPSQLRRWFGCTPRCFCSVLPAPDWHPESVRVRCDKPRNSPRWAACAS